MPDREIVLHSNDYVFEVNIKMLCKHCNTLLNFEDGKTDYASLWRENINMLVTHMTCKSCKATYTLHINAAS